MHGKGLLIWKDGNRYLGNFYLDKRQGRGVFTWKDGRTYDGSFQNSKQHGEGVYTKNGVKKKGMWENGKNTKWISEEKVLLGGDKSTM